MDRWSRVRTILVGAVLFVLVGSAVDARAESVVLQPVRDNTLFETVDGSTSSGAGVYLFAGQNSQQKLRRALIAFDLVGSIPNGARIDSVSLSLHVSNVNNDAERTLTIHRVLADWGEGTSDSGTGGGGATTTPGDATWIHRRSPDQLWATPGGDFIEAASASVATTGVGSYSVQSEGLRADVQAWADEPTDALGWIILGDETEPTTARRIDSRENEEPANRPTLTIFFSRVDPVLSSSWGEIKLRFGR